jgi:Ca2+-binding EF-hand superfamily protein
LVYAQWMIIGTIDSAELKTAMESLGYKKKNKMAYQMIENMKQGEIDFNAYDITHSLFVSYMTTRHDTTCHVLLVPIIVS